MKTHFVSSCGCSALVFSLFLLLPGFASATESALPAVPEEPKQAARPGSQAVGRLGEAIELVAYAREAKSVPAMVTAVQLIRAAGPVGAATRVSGEKSKAGAKAEGEPKTSAGAAALDPDALLAEARAWAGGDASLTALIDREAAATAEDAESKGRVGGPACVVDRVLAGDVDFWPIQFRANESATIVVHGDGDTDLDCYLYDQAGNIFKTDESYSPHCVLQ